MADWNNPSLLEAIQAQFASAVVSSEETYGMLNIEVNANDAYAVIEWLKNHNSLRMDYLTDLCAVHYPEQAGREIAVVYHLHSLINNVRLRLKAFLPIEKPEIATLTPLFSAANWMERETYDFYGVNFIGHPDMRRILNMDEMDYFPLRKEYALEDETRTDKADKYFGR